MYASYREPLCELDNRGIPVFSPLCAPHAKVDTAPVKFPMPKTECDIKPVEQRRPRVSQFDDAPSAHDWDKDPTYAQRIGVRRRGLDDGILDTNPSLAEYHRIKTMEKVAGSLMQSMGTFN
jgi:hypothetical protein